MPWRPQLDTLGRGPTVPALGSAMHELEAWFDTPLGQRMLAEQRTILSEVLSNLFGYHLMQLSINRKVRLFEASRICHCFTAAPQAQGAAAEVGVVSELDALPLADDTVDVTLLHHVLEFSPNPHQVLREASRVTISRGYLVIFGFNPWSLLGAVKPVAQLWGRGPIWRRDSLSRARIEDWLKLVECNTVQQLGGLYSWPLSGRHGGDSAPPRIHWPFGGFYCLVARKDRACLTPIKPAWSAAAVMPPVPRKQAISARSAARIALVRKPSERGPQA